MSCVIPHVEIPCVCGIHADRLVLVPEDTECVAVHDAHTGQRLWSREFDHDVIAFLSGQIIVVQQLSYSSRGRTTYGLDLISGTQLWSEPDRWSLGGSKVTENHLYHHIPNRGTHRLDARTGDLEPMGPGWSSFAVDDDGTAYGSGVRGGEVVSEAGPTPVHLPAPHGILGVKAGVVLSGAEGQPQCTTTCLDTGVSVQHERPEMANWRFASGALLYEDFAPQHNEVRAFDPRTGELLWRRVVSRRPITMPVGPYVRIMGDGLLIPATGERVLDSDYMRVPWANREWAVLERSEALEVHRLTG